MVGNGRALEDLHTAANPHVFSDGDARAGGTAGTELVKIFVQNFALPRDGAMIADLESMHDDEPAKGRRITRPNGNLAGGPDVDAAAAANGKIAIHKKFSANVQEGSVTGSLKAKGNSHADTQAAEHLDVAAPDDPGALMGGDAAAGDFAIERIKAIPRGRSSLRSQAGDPLGESAHATGAGSRRVPTGSICPAKTPRFASAAVCRAATNASCTCAGLNSPR